MGKILKIHTHIHSIYGVMHRWEPAVQRRRLWSTAAASTTSPRGTHPCAQAIIVNDKVTIEVLIVLN